MRKTITRGVSWGNVRNAAARRGWFLGHFVTSDPARQTRNVEMKWGVHRVGAKKKLFEGNHKATSMSVLIKGRFRFEFRQAGRIESVRLKRTGDFVIWSAKVEHRGFAEEDSTLMLTVRWPSLPMDHYNCEG